MKNVLLQCAEKEKCNETYLNCFMNQLMHRFLASTQNLSILVLCTERPAITDRRPVPRSRSIQ